MEKEVVKIDDLDFEKQDGLIPAIIQDADNNQVLMLAYMSPESLRLTLETGLCTYWSRSRNCFWVKGKTSDSTQEVREIFYDCDADTLLIKVKQNGSGACHTGNRSCFYRKMDIKE